MTKKSSLTLERLREALRRDNCIACGSPLLMDERDNERCPVCQEKFTRELNELYASHGPQYYDNDMKDMESDRPLSSRDDEPF